MDRREFFRRSTAKATEKAVQSLEARARERARQWIRPPFALPELEFLLACSRCQACVEACPHSVIFPLAARLGGDVAASPALDLQHRGCHLCADWPCVHACETGALKLPELADNAPPPLPRLARASVDTATCLPYTGPECGVCVSACPVPGALALTRDKPVIDETACTGCGLCREVCVVADKAIWMSAV
jgi:ferredoxin-type protein NapG